MITGVIQFGWFFSDCRFGQLIVVWVRGNASGARLQAPGFWTDSHLIRTNPGRFLRNDMTIYCQLPPTYCLLLSAYRQLMGANAGRSLRYDRVILLSTAYRLLPTAYHLLPIVYCQLPPANCLLQNAHCLFPIAYCLSTFCSWSKNQLILYLTNRVQSKNLSLCVFFFLAQ
jgi:hypothetical protein